MAFEGLSKKLVEDLPVRLFVVNPISLPIINQLPQEFISPVRRYAISVSVPIKGSEEYHTHIRYRLGGKTFDIILVPENPMGDEIWKNIKKEFPDKHIVYLPAANGNTKLEDYLNAMDQNITNSFQ